jgi:integrase
MTRRLPPYTHCFRDRHGRLRCYYRRHGKRIRLPLPNDPDFMLAYQRAATPPEAAEATIKNGSVDAAIISYYQSAAFKELAQSTKYMQRSQLERFRKKYGAKNIATMPTEFISRLVASRSSHVARGLVKALRRLMRHAKAVGLVQSDPTKGVELPKPKDVSRWTWTEEEIATYEAKHPIGTKARLAMALGLYTSQRRGDVVKMGRQHIQGDALVVRQSKTGTTLQIPLHPDLQQIIAATPGNLTFLTTSTGRPYSPGDLGIDFREWCREAGMLPRCTFHGLRYAMARRLAEQGATTHQIAAITGHKSLREIERYTRAASQARLAREAMKLIGAGGKNRTPIGKPSPKIGNPH